MVLNRETYLYAVGRMDLDKVEHDCAVLLAPLLFPWGRRAPRVRVSPTWMHRRGVGASEVWATRALRDLVGRKMLEDLGAHLYAPQPIPCWDWPEERLEMVRGELVDMACAPSFAWAVPSLSELMMVIPGTPGTPHPYDPVFYGWVETCCELAGRYGKPRVLDALAEAAREPEALGTFAPRSFRTVFYALVQRAHRRRHAPS